MKTELRLAPHSQLTGQYVVEVWYAGHLVGQVTGSDHEPGVRILSKYALTSTNVPNEKAAPVSIVEVYIGEPRLLRARPGG